MAKTTAVDYGFLREVVFRHSHNILDPSCDYLFEARLSRLLRERGYSGIDDVMLHLRAQRDPALERSIAESMTIKETSFFRDTRCFDVLNAELIPALARARRSARSLRFWSAASSTGQEAYSLAILLHENFSNDGAWNIRVEGTDLASHAVDQAHRGVFHRIEINRGLSACRIVRYFDRVGENWIVRPEIRRLCNFQQANLCQPHLPFRDPFDVIFLRNVLLYFAEETRRKLLMSVRRLLAPDGILFLGSAEQPPEDGVWKSVLRNGACYYRPL